MPFIRPVRQATESDPNIGPVPPRLLAEADGQADETETHGTPGRFPFRIRTLESLRYRDYRLLWLSATFMSTGQYFRSVVVGWLTYDVTGSPVLTVLALALGSVPSLLATPIGGVLADRIDRRKIISGVAGYNALLTFGFSVLLLTNGAQPWQILTYVLVVGIGAAIDLPASTSYVTYVVPNRVLLNGFALLSLAYNVATVIGPAVAGLMLAAYGPSSTLWLAAGLMLAPAVFAAMLKVVKPTSEPAARPSILKQIVEGMAVMVREPVAMALFLTQIMVYGLMSPAVYGLLPVYAVEVFHVGPAGLGALNSSLGVGAVIGVLIVATLGSAVRRGASALVLLIGASVAMIGFSQSTSILVGIVMLVLIHGCLASLTAVKSSGIQALVPSELRGRVAAITSMSNGAFPIGGLVLGAVAQWQDAPTATLAAGATVLVLTAGLYVKYPQLRRYK